MKATDSQRLSIHEICELAIICALMVGGKEVLNALPNIHPVMLLILLCVRLYGAKAFYPVTGFVIIETMLFGVSIWTVTYFYIWPLYTLCALPFRKTESRVFWAIYAGICGLLFGPLSAIVTWIIADWPAAVAYWVAGIPYDMIHCASNFVIVLLLLDPLTKLVMKIRSQSGSARSGDGSSSASAG